MRQPLWILNASLFAIGCIALAFIVLVRAKLPPREDIGPLSLPQSVKIDVSKINISRIYEHDLFDTYQKAAPAPTEQLFITPVPQPPPPKSIFVPARPQPKFLEPLKIALKGIIVQHADETHNRAIIADTQTGREKLYKVGDLIEDASLLRILTNKVIFVRSNGQQEVLYVRQQDAKLDPAFAEITGWGSIVKKISGQEFTLNVPEFTQRISSLGQLIDTLDIVTVFKQGSSIGFRIGNLDETSIGAALGLTTGDIVISINGIPTATTENRMAIYKDITLLHPGDSITITFERRGIPMNIVIKLIQEASAAFTSSPQISPAQAAPVASAYAHVSQEDIANMMQEKNKFSTTMQQARRQDRRNMLSQSELTNKAITQGTQRAPTIG